MSSSKSKNDQKQEITTNLRISGSCRDNERRVLSGQDLLAEMESRMKFLKRVIAEKKKSLQKAPDGELRFNRHGNNVQYYCRLDPKDTSGKYIRKKEHSFAAALAQKDYDRKVLKQADEELKWLQSAIGKMQFCKLDTVYEELPAERRCLVEPVIMTDEQYIEQWLSVKYEKKEFSDDMPEYYSAKGERVRSKTEIIIANTLNDMQIPYLYEFPVYLEKFGTVHPDFRVLNVRLRKTYLWEHMGMMDNAGYVEDAMHKLNAYFKNGYLPGDNLIITHESGADPLSTKLIEQYIEHYLM